MEDLWFYFLMGFFKNLFSTEKAEDKEEGVLEEVIEEENQTSKIDPNAPLYQNEVYCNACGRLIENTPRFFNFNGRNMIFHKNCLKKLKKGNIQL